MIKDTTGKINLAGIISNISFSDCSFSKYIATAATDNTVDWLVDCGIPKKLAMSREMETEKRMIETTFPDIIPGGNNSFPMMVDVAFPAIIAPKNTIIPKSHGIKLRRITLAPKAAEKAGQVPLPPIFMAKKITMISGNTNGLNKDEIIIYCIFNY